MSASYTTVREILAAVQRHCTPEQVTSVLEEVAKIPGNSSFRETARRMLEEHRLATRKREKRS